MTLQAGQVLIDRYFIQTLLHQGGMGAVYRAMDQTLNCPVAIKERLPDPLASAEALVQARQQFEHEAQTLGRLAHPVLPRVTNFFSANGNEYLVMDFVEGVSLEAMLRQYGSFPEPTVIHWGRQLLDALIYIHSHNIIHRDLKPANIIVKTDGSLTLVDFGLVKLIDPNDPRTVNALRGMGTPEYSPLEQYSGNALHTDARSDIYALGATLYHLLTGRPPLPVHQRMLDAAQQPAPRAINANITPGMEAIVLKAMSIHPQERFQTAREMDDALENPSGFMGIHQTAGANAETVLVAPRRKPAVAPTVWIAIALVFAVAMFLGGVIVTMLVVIPNLATPAQVAVITATPAPATIAPTIAPTAASTIAPTVAPTALPSIAPINTPTPVPPTIAPTAAPPGTEGMVFVPAGDFWMGAGAGDVAVSADEKPGGLIYVSAFWIDKYEISNAQFKACVDAGKCDRPSGVFGPQSPHEAYGNPQFDNYPVVLISLYNAAHYCEWKGKYLPYEAEWEKAARGNQDQRIYPWGNDWDGYKANAKNVGGTAQVNSYSGGCSLYGACNLAGNVAEWIADHYNSNWYKERSIKNITRDPVFWDPGLKPQFNVRGGSYNSAPADVRVSKRASRNGDDKTMRDVGFRCVKR